MATLSISRQPDNSSSDRPGRHFFPLNSFNLYLSYRLGSKNTHFQILHSNRPPVDPDFMLPRTCVLGAISCEVKERVLCAQDLGSLPEGCPPNRLFISADHKSAVIQWAHASLLSCHSGVQKTLSLLCLHFWFFSCFWKAFFM